MSIRPFSLFTVIRMVPKELLEQCFQKLGFKDRNLCDACLYCSKQSLVATFRDFFLALQPEQKDSIEGVMHSISDLASESGSQAMLDAAPHCGVPDLMSRVPYDLCNWGRAAWIWLHYPKVVDRAQVIHQVDHLKWWRKRDDLPRVEPKTSEQDLRELARYISRRFQSEGRGKECTVEHLARNTVDYYFAFPDDFMKSFTVHDEQGKLAAASVRGTVLVVFAYDRAKGTLDVCAKVPKQAKEGLESTFASIILDTHLRAYRPWPYGFAMLKDSHFKFATDPADQVHVALWKLRLTPPGDDTTWTVQIAEWNANSGTDFRELLQKCLNFEAIPFSEWRISMMELTFDFLPKDGRKAKKVRVDIAEPRSLNIRDDSPERTELILKYLRLWGIERDRPVREDLGAVA